VIQLTTTRLQNASFATKLRDRIIDCRDRFVPVTGHVSNLRDVKFKDTEIVFVSKRDAESFYRVEAEIDHDSDGGVDHYNVGTIKFFRDTDKRRVMMNMTVIDVEK